MIRVRWGVAVVLAALAPVPPAAAQNAAVASPVVLQPPQAAPYRSAFDSFKPFNETREADWRAANDRVLATGGHGGALEDGETDGTDDKVADPHAGHRQ